MPCLLGWGGFPFQAVTLVLLRAFLFIQLSNGIAACSLGSGGGGGV